MSEEKTRRIKSTGEESQTDTGKLNAVEPGSAEEGRIVSEIHDQMIRFMQGLLRQKRGTSQRFLFSDTSSILLRAILAAIRDLGPFQSQQHFRSTVAKVGVGKAIDEYRKWVNDKLAKERMSTETVEAFQSDVAAASDVDAALRELSEHSPQVSEVIQARVYGVMTWKETAEHLDRSEHICRSQWKIGAMFLRRHLAGHSIDE